LGKKEKKHQANNYSFAKGKNSISTQKAESEEPTTRWLSSQPTTSAFVDPNDDRPIKPK
jgi:hypothetical protein